MPAITVRNIPMRLYRYLCREAKKDGRSPNEELREIIITEARNPLRRLLLNQDSACSDKLIARRRRINRAQKRSSANKFN